MPCLVWLPRSAPLRRGPQIMELLEHKSIFTAGYKCILHVHAAVEECECIQLDARLDMKTKQKLTVRGPPLPKPPLA